MKTTIRACTRNNRIPLSLSNFLYMPYAEASKEFYRIVEGQPFTGYDIAKALNNHPNILRNFRTYRETSTQVQLIAVDFIGNEAMIYITKKA